MTYHHPSDLNSGIPKSVTSSPRSDCPAPPPGLNEDLQSCVRFMCSFGGRILPRPHDNQLRYVGGDTRIVAVHRTITFSSLLIKIAELSGTTDVAVKYQLPNEDLDALISVTTDEDVENMIEEYDRLTHSVNPKTARLRLFLFPLEADSDISSLASLLNCSSKREHWFFDQLNGRLERGRSEASSIISEVPDYLFGLDNSEEPREPKPRTRTGLADNVSVSDPGSPAPVASSPYCSTSSSNFMPSIPNLPPVKTEPENPISGAESKENLAEPGNPVWHYLPGSSHISAPPVTAVPLYYVPGPVPSGNAQVQPAPMHAQYVQQFHAPVGQIPMAYRHAIPGQMYELPRRVIGDGGAQQVYYGAENVGVVPTMLQR